MTEKSFTVKTFNNIKSELGKVSKNILEKANCALNSLIASKPVEKHRQCNHVV